jgi:hypothetical protein
MIVQPTDKWINSIAVPNCGIIRKPFNSDVADVSDAVGNWLIEAGFAVAKKETVAIELPHLQIAEPLTLPEKPIESFKSKKASKLFVNPES